MRRGAPDVVINELCWLRFGSVLQFLDIVRAAPTSSVDPDVDPDDVFDMLLGAILARTLIPTVAAHERPLERLVDMTGCTCSRLEESFVGKEGHHNGAATSQADLNAEGTRRKRAGTVERHVLGSRAGDLR